MTTRDAKNLTNHIARAMTENEHFLCRPKHLIDGIQRSVCHKLIQVALVISLENRETCATDNDMEGARTQPDTNEKAVANAYRGFAGGLCRSEVFFEERVVARSDDHKVVAGCHSASARG